MEIVWKISNLFITIPLPKNLGYTKMQTGGRIIRTIYRTNKETECGQSGLKSWYRYLEIVESKKDHSKPTPT